MDIFDEMCIRTVSVVLIVTSIFVTGFFGFLYFSVQKKKNILMLFLANVFVVISSFVLNFGFNTGNHFVFSVITIPVTLVVSMWIYSAFLVLNITTTFTTLLAINILNTVQALLFYFLTKSSNLPNVINAILISLSLMYAVYKMLRQLDESNRREIIYTSVVFALIIVFGLGRGVYRYFNPAELSEAGMEATYVPVSIILNFVFAFVMNFTLLFLNFNDFAIKIEELSHIDALTEVYVRNTFLVMLSQKLLDVKRGSANIAVALLDIDDFKRINDTYGHLMGDEVLMAFSREMKSCLRENDIMGRFGGEEFMIIMEVGSREEALVALKRLQSHFDGKRLIDDERITFSCGFMFINQDNCDIKIREIIKTVDDRMYKAKASGKNAIV